MDSRNDERPGRGHHVGAASVALVWGGEAADRGGALTLRPLIPIDRDHPFRAIATSCGRG